MGKKFKTEWVKTNDLYKSDYLSKMLEIFLEEGWNYVDKIRINAKGNTFKVMLIFSKDE